MNWTVTCFILNVMPRMPNGRKLRGYQAEALLSGRAMDVYARVSNENANDYNKLKKALLTGYNFTEDGYR